MQSWAIQTQKSSGGSYHAPSHTLRPRAAQCTVAANLDVTCSPYVLGRVGHTNADAALTASYPATIDCFNKGTSKNNPARVPHDDLPGQQHGHGAVDEEGAGSAPQQSVSAFSAPQVCPNPNWMPQIRSGTLALNSFTYTLTFAGFSSTYITIAAIDP